MARHILLTCEHAGNAIPESLKPFFNGAQIALKTHRGWDLGAVEVCQELADLLHAKDVFLGEWSRLLIDLNRSEHHPKVFSQWTQGLNSLEKDYWLQSVHRPFREKVYQAIQTQLAQGMEVLHLSIHSFTPSLDGDVRNNDVGLLYDPKRKAEQKFAMAWQDALERHEGILVRRNYPYRGILDGHTSDIRKKIPRGYLGIEVELNQAYLEKHAPQTVARLLADTLPKV